MQKLLTFLIAIFMVFSGANAAEIGDGQKNAQIVTTEYVQSYLRQHADMPELELMGAGPDTLASEEYILGAIDFVNGDGNLRTHARPNTLAGISYLPNIADKINTCPVPWDTAPEITVNVSKAIVPDLNTKRPLGDDFFPRGVEYGDGVFVVVGYEYDSDGESILMAAYSTDGGNTWTRSDTHPVAAPDWYSDAIIYGDKTFVIMGKLDDVYYLISSDDMGKNWTSVETDIRRIFYSDGAFVAFNSNGQSMYSVDGCKTWSSPVGLPVDFGDYMQFAPIVYGDGNFVVCSESYGVSDCAYSNDNGKTWEKTTMPFRGNGAYGNGIFVFLSNDLMDSEKGVFTYSVDGGKTWSEPIESGAKYPCNVLYANGTFVFAGYGYAAYSSDNGQTWASSEGYIRTDWGFWTVVDDIFFIGGRGAPYDPDEDGLYTAQYSVDGKVWQTIRWPYGRPGYPVFGNGKIMVGGYDEWGVADVVSDARWTVETYISGIATCENAVCSCTRQKLINNGEYVDNVSQTPVEINRTFADQNACNRQCADVCADNAVNNTDGAQKDILCGK